MTEHNPDGAAPRVPDPTAANIDIADLFERAERELLGGPRRYTRIDIAELSGVPAEQSRRLWRALGFASVADDDVVFTDGDVNALRAVGILRDHGIDDQDRLAAMTRMLGQTFSRLASWQGQLLLELLGERPDLLVSEDAMLGTLTELVPVLEDVQAFVWRRQLAAYFSRVASHAANEVSGVVPAVVGFADMQGFTSLTRRASEGELRALLVSFE